MELVLTITFILTIGIWVGYRGIAPCFAGVRIHDVMKSRVFDLVLLACLLAGMAIAASSRFNLDNMPVRNMLVMTSSMVMVLSLFSSLRIKTSAVTAFWGVLLAVMSHNDTTSQYPLAPALLSLLAAPVLGVAFTWLFRHIFDKAIYKRDTHLLVKGLQVKQFSLIGVLLACIALALNCALLINTLTTSCTSQFTLSEWWQILVVALPSLICMIAAVLALHNDTAPAKPMKGHLPSLYALASVLLTLNVAVTTIVHTALPVVVSINQIRQSNKLLLDQEHAAQHLMHLLCIMVVTPLVAFSLASALLALHLSTPVMLIIIAFVLLSSLLAHLYFNQYAKHRVTKKALSDEMSHKNEVGDEMSRMDVAAATSQFSVISKEIDLKQKELINLSLYIKQQRQYLEELSTRLMAVIDDEPEVIREKVRALAGELNENIKLTGEMDQFYTQVEEMHKNFVSRLLMRCPNLSEREKRLAILLRLGFSSKEIAHLMNVEPKSVEINRYRFRRKLKLDRSVNIVQYLQIL
ncbi:MAG: response regulator transcription factor [Muribaculaceae bacterium]|nr:response regulator transcription factor [Muribaculaceae bacterium]